jgi:hypothetical protein
VGEALFKSLIESLQKSTGQKPNGVRRPKIEWALSDSVDRFFQKPSHVSDALQWNPREIAVRNLPMTVSLPSLSAKLGQFLGMRMKKAQAPFHGGRLACTASLRPSLTLFPGLPFQGFVYPPVCRRPSALAASSD